MSKENRNSSYGEENDINLSAFIGINRGANRAMKRASTIFREHGLTTMQFAVLEVLYHKGDLKIGQITEKILSTGGNMTVVINNLQKEGMVEKYADRRDSRASVIHITEKGEKKIEEIFPHYLSDLKLFFAKINEEEKVELARILKKLMKDG
ncbi:MAG TPA: MarR family transcriptional regulator [Candidatus Merdenecus merdavium]|nr:MarR family transcriptional regulator [Candidatus Merdenecus merdavium]